METLKLLWDWRITSQFSQTVGFYSKVTAFLFCVSKIKSNIFDEVYHLKKGVTGKVR